MTSPRAVVSAFVLITFLTWQANAFLLDGPVKSPLRVAAFNIQHFGVTKMSDDAVAKKIVQILNRYDIVLVQEVRDSSHNALDQLLTLLNCCTVKWEYVSSLPIGRTSYKEQYVFFYRKDLLNIEATYTYPDTKDVYEREPFAAKIEYYSVTQSNPRHVVLAGVHIQPRSTDVELQELGNTINRLTTVWSNVDGVIMMGDFNADCNYLNEKERESLAILSSSSGFKSLIPDTVDTTVNDNTDCTYDRIVAKGTKLDLRNGKVYDFQADFNMSTDDALEVSDHFPVEFMLY